MSSTTTTTIMNTEPPRVVKQRSLSPNTQHLANPSPSGLEGRRRSSEKERFPSFDYSAQPSFPLPPVIESSVETRSEQFKWPSRHSGLRAQVGHRNSTPRGHRAKRSVSDVLVNFRDRNGSVVENTQELAEALKVPISYKLIALCVVWYMTSALTNTSSKSILNAFPQPVTLTIIQFASVSLWCLLLTSVASAFPGIKRAVPALKNGLRYPSVEVLQTALPLSIFQLLGHLLSSYSTSKIPVSLVHTIKGLSPLFTVFAYRFFLGIRYARNTYLSLVPLTFGVMLACSKGFSTDFWGIAAALVAAIVFVAQNIFSKKLFSQAETSNTKKGKKLDKLNLLCYCSVGAFLLSAPVWFWTEGVDIMRDYWADGSIELSPKKNALDHGQLALEFFFNGLFHFFQNIMAFVLLSMMSPVSYSVASLIKRVWVIVLAVIWFRNSINLLQFGGVALTCVGLYLYDRFSAEDAAERRTKQDHFKPKQALLPLQELKERQDRPTVRSPQNVPGMNGSFAFPNISKRGDEGRSGPSQMNPSQWLPPGTKQEYTWSPGEKQQQLQ